MFGYVTLASRAIVCSHFCTFFFYVCGFCLLLSRLYLTLIMFAIYFAIVFASICATLIVCRTYITYHIIIESYINIYNIII